MHSASIGGLSKSWPCFVQATACCENFSNNVIKDDYLTITK